MGTNAKEIDWLITQAPDLKDGEDWVKSYVRGEGPERRVTIHQAFRLGAHEVMVGQFREFVNATKYLTEAEKSSGGFSWNNDLRKWEQDPGNVWSSPKHSGSKTHPVVFMTPADARAFCAWLTEKEGFRYALPTEEQWEYACRAGAVTRWYFGDDAAAIKGHGWTVPHSSGKHQPVGRLAANPFGLFDVYGNATELTFSPQNAIFERGGQSNEAPHRARSAWRPPVEKVNETHSRRGFRVALVGDLKARTLTPSYALLFDGKTSSVAIPTLKRDDATGPLTIEAWAGADKAAQTMRMVFILGGDKAPCTLGQNGNVWAATDQQTGPRVLGSRPATPGERAHLALVIDTQELRFYVDGALAERRPRMPKEESNLTAEHAWIGARQRKKLLPTVDHFSGLIGPVRVSKAARYDKDFTPTQRFEPDADTLALYHFDEGQGEVLKDSSSNNHHGKIVGAKWVKADGATIADDPFVILRKDANAERKFATLAEAVATAQSGDTIEIRGDGPFLTEPIDLQAKDLVVRAGQGFRPVLKQKPETIAALAPLIYTRGSLVLEGLELQRTGSQGDGWLGPAVVSYDSSLHVLNCRFLSVGNDKGNGSILHQDSDQCEIRNSLFVAGKTDGIFGFGSMNRRQVVLANNLCISQSGGWTFNLDPDPAGGDVPIRITRNTLVHGFVMALNEELPPMKPKENAKPRMRFDARENVVDPRKNGWENFLSFHQVQGLNKPGAKELSPQEADEFLRHRLAWSEGNNVYPEGVQSLGLLSKWQSLPSTQRRQGLKDWNEFWKLSDTGSIEGQVRYQGGDLPAKLKANPDKMATDDFRLVKGSSGQGMLPGGKDVGADVDLVGPGAAYERWKTTPDYQEWRKKINVDKR